MSISDEEYDFYSEGMSSGLSINDLKYRFYAQGRSALAPSGGNKVVFLGDSITSAQGNEVNAPYQWGLSYPAFATYLSKGKLIRLRNTGVAGDRVADMLARFESDVAAYSPSIVAVLAGTNDWNDSNPTPLDTYKREIFQLVSKIRALGALPIICTVPPNVLSAARRKRTIIGNAWLRSFAANEGLPLVDFYSLLTDPATGDYLAAYGSAGNDKTHPLNAGYVEMGRFFVDEISSYLPPTAQLLPAENADPNNLLTNGLFLTTTGAGATLIPTGWSVQTGSHPTGITGSLITNDSTIKGNWWQIVADGTAAATNNEFQAINTGIVGGHKYAHVGRFKATGMRGADAGNGSGFLLGAAFNSVLNTTGYDYRVASTHYYNVSEGCYYHEMTAPENATSLLIRRQLIQTSGGAGTLQVAQVGLYDLTAMGLD